jgi:hypothetical protein
VPRTSLFAGGQGLWAVTKLGGGGAADTVAYDASVPEFDQTLALVYLLSRYRGVSKQGFSFAGLPARVDAQDKKIASLNDEIASHKLKITSLEDRVGSLMLSLDAYKILRNLFISTYKRDKLASDIEVDRWVIGVGNAWAHGGDAVVDAQLYEGMGGRTDYTSCTGCRLGPYRGSGATGHRPQHRPHEPMRCPHR